MLSPEELPPESISMNQLVLSSARVARPPPRHAFRKSLDRTAPPPPHAEGKEDRRATDTRLIRGRVTIRRGVGISRPYFAVTFVVFGRVCRKSRRRHVFTRYRVRGRRTEEVLVVVVVDHVRA